MFELSSSNTNLNIPFSDESTPAEDSNTPIDGVDIAVGKYLSFDGNDYAFINNTPALQMGGGKLFSVSAWFRTSEFVQYAPIVIKSTDGINTDATYTLQYWDSEVDKKLGFVIGDGSGSQGYQGIFIPAPTLNEWHYVVGVYDGINMYLYIDGEIANSVPAKISPRENAEPLRVGSYSGGAVSNHPYKGDIGQIKLYSRPLMAQEVRDNYIRVLSKGLIAQWTFDGSTEEELTRGKTDVTKQVVSEKGTINFASGVSGQALDLSKEEGYLTVAHNDDNSLSPEEGSVSAWFMETGVSEPFAGIVAKSRDAQDRSTNEYILLLGDEFNEFPGNPSNPLNNKTSPERHTIRAQRTNMSIDYSDGSTKYSSSVVDASDRTRKSFQKNVWHHAVMTWNSTNHSLYIDGEFESMTGMSGDAVTNTEGPLIIGAILAPTDENLNKGKVRNFNGSIDDVKIYSRKLSSGEISQLYNSYPDAKLRVSYNFDDNVNDISGNGIHGENIGGVEFSQGIVGKALKFGARENQSINLGDR